MDALQWSTQLDPPSSLSVALWDEAGPPGCTPPRREGREGGERGRGEREEREDEKEREVERRGIVFNDFTR